MYIKSLLLILFLFQVGPARAEFNHWQFNFSLAMINAGFQENEAQIESGGTKELSPEAGAVSAIGMELEFEKYSSAQKSWAGKLIAPVMVSGAGSYYSMNVTRKYYFSSISSPSTFEDDNDSLKFNPKWRFFWLWGLGGSFLVYNTENKIKNDTLAELILGTGAFYSLTKDWDIKGEFNIARGVGLTTSTMVMKIFIGGALLHF